MDPEKTVPETADADVGVGTETPPEPEAPPEKTYTQEQVNRIVAERLKRAQTKADAKVNEASQGMDALSAQVNELTEKLAGIEAERDKLRHDADLASWKAQVTQATGIPAAVLRGDTLEELQAHAEAIKSAMPVYPTVTEAAGTAAPVTRESIMAIKNQSERLDAIAQHLDLFN